MSPVMWVLSFELNGRQCWTHSPVVFHVMMNHLRSIGYRKEVNQSVTARLEQFN